MHGVVKSFNHDRSVGTIASPEHDLEVVFDGKSILDRESSPIWVGEPVSFGRVTVFKRVDGTEGRRADSVRRLSRLTNWAFVPLPDVLYELNEILLDEHWEFGDSRKDDDRPFPILRSYLFWTFFRLQREGKKIMQAQRIDGRWLASFNTGLVDKRYEPIYALFVSGNNPGRQPWEYAAFCIAGEKPAGKDLVRYFKPLPEPAHYFDKISDLIYDTDAGEPEVDWEHVVIHNIGRLPLAFLRRHCPPGFNVCDPTSLPPIPRKDYLWSFGDAVKDDDETYRAIINRLRDAVELSIKRTRWNFKTAIPMYYPTKNQMNLLLPISLVSDKTVDIALVVEKTPSGNYPGHTILPLDLAYGNARLVCRPDSDWLVPDGIARSTAEDLDEADEDTSQSVSQSAPTDDVAAN